MPSTSSQSALRKRSGPKTDGNYAQPGNEKKVAVAPNTATNTCVQVADSPTTELSDALARRKLNPHTPYIASVWEKYLRAAKALNRFSKVPEGFRSGFHLDFPIITHVQIPPNKDSINQYRAEFNTIIEKEFKKDRYLGPFVHDTLERLIGPFQSSPLSIIPKPGKPGKYRLVQNFSFPHSLTPTYPNPSINSFIDSNRFPTTWGKFSIIYLLISRLPAGSEVATRDVAEAYRTIPLHPSQWPSSVVRVSDSEFCVDTCMAFGAAPSAGAYGHVADAGAEIFRHHGIGPLDKWVDDHLFVRIRREFLAEYNAQRSKHHRDLAEKGMQQTGSRLWFGRLASDGSIEEFNEDCSWPLKDLSEASRRSDHDKLFGYCLSDIDDLSTDLGIVWEIQKDQPFATSTICIGFHWDVMNLVVSLSVSKVSKYLLAIHNWRRRQTHVLQDVRELYGKLLHTCEVVKHGRAYLTSLESMMGICSDKPYLPHRPIKDVEIDLLWWSELLQNGAAARPILPPIPFSDPLAYSDASSTIGIAIVIGRRWRAWRLIPGWQTRNGQRDIGWAEAVGFELLVRSLATLPEQGNALTVYGDNTGVVEGWWKGRSRNKEVNLVFRRVHEYIRLVPKRFEIRTSYVASKHNPADEPSRGIYPPRELLLPPINIPPAIQQFIVDATEPPTPTELKLLRDGSYPPAAAKVVDRARLHWQGVERARASREEEDQLLCETLHGTSQ